MKKFLLIFLLCFISFLFPLSSSLAITELKPCIEIGHCVREEWDVSNINEPFLGVKKIIINNIRTEIVEARENYIHAEVTSRIMKYIDDLDIVLSKPRLKNTMKALYNEAQDMEL